MQKAAEELKKQQEREAEEKKRAVESRVPKLDIDGLDQSKSPSSFLHSWDWHCQSTNSGGALP